MGGSKNISTIAALTQQLTAILFSFYAVMPDLFTTELQNAVASAYVFCRKLKNLYSMGIMWNRTAV